MPSCRGRERSRASAGPATDGAEYALRSRVVDFDPLAQQATLEMQAFMWRDGELVAEEEHVLTMTLYFKDELVLMLERAGFDDVRVRGQYNDAEPTAGRRLPRLHRAARRPEMTLQNRVTPLGDLVADPARGLVYGNRGCLHDAQGRIRRRFAVKRWIACRLEFRGRRRSPLQQPGRYTELFFLDEVTALAAGHRPCAECRREDYDRLVAHLAGSAPGPGRSRRDRRPAPCRAPRSGFEREAPPSHADRRAPGRRFRPRGRRAVARAGSGPLALDALGVCRAQAATRPARGARDHAAVAPRAAAVRLEPARPARPSVCDSAT